MERQALGPYELTRLLGRGGMGEVYLAHDPRLGRAVALKVLPRALADQADRRERFLREARSVSSLNHPNICTIHDIGTADDRTFIALEYVAGETLQSLLARGELPLDRLLDIALPLAEALAYAHNKGVVHRDLKPANVMISELGLPKILDFGLAKIIEPTIPAAGDAPTHDRLTDAGLVLGTVGYMSPEQALGKSVDARSDAFAFGALLYEMATGTPAFRGDSSTQVLDAVLHGEPKPLAKVRPDLPPEFVQIVEKALRKDPNERYQHMADLAVDLRHLKSRSTAVAPVGRLIATVDQRRRIAVAAGVAIVAVLGGLFAYRTYMPGASSAPPNSIAVLNFENVADRSDADNTARMLTSLLITELSSAGQLQVVISQRLHDIARQLGHRDGPLDRSVATEVTRRAGARTMVLGELARIGERSVATTELVDMSSGRLLGSPRAEGTKVEDMFSMAEALGAQIRERIGSPSSGAAKIDLARQLTQSVDAYRAYVRGETFYQRLDLEKAYEQFREAARLDEDFALAQYRLSMAAIWTGRDAEGRAAAERSLGLLTQLPAAYVDIVRANALFVDGRYSAALPILERVLDSDPNSKDALYLMGEIYAHSARDNDPARTRTLLEKLLAHDPDYRLAYSHVIAASMQQWDLATVRQRLDQFEGAEPEVVQLVRSLLTAMEGRPAEALELGRGVTIAFFRPWRTEFAITARRWELAAKLASEELPRGWISAWMNRARGHLGVYRGRFDSALEAYQQAAEGARQHDGLEGGVPASALESRAMLLMLTGDIKAARVEAERARSVQPDGARWRYFAGTVALRDRDPSAAATHLNAIQGLMGVGQSPSIALYHDGLEAEIALAQGRASEALPLFEKLVQSGKPYLDYSAAFSSPKPAFRDGLVRTYLALGEQEKAATALEALLASGFERVNHPVLYVRALYTLAKLKVEQRDPAGAAKLFHDFLEHWGNADRDLPEVREARTYLRMLSH